MTYKQIIKDLKNKIYKPIYLLMGEESYYIDNITNYIIDNVLKEDEKAFNMTILYGKDTSVNLVDNVARRYPMMANYNLVIIKEAQNLKNIDKLIYYSQAPSKSTILVLNYKYKTLDKRKKVYKAIKSAGIIFESKKLYANKIPDWINQYLNEKKYSIEPVACNLLTEFLGNDLGKISNELDKLIISLPANTKISSKHIEENIGISKDYNNFELQNALMKKDILKANRIIDYFGKNPRDNPVILTITSLYFFFNKILIYHFLKDKSRQNAASKLKVNPYFLKDYEMASKKYNPKKVVQIISLLREYDLKLKGVGNVSTTGDELLKELIFKIIH